MSSPNDNFWLRDAVNPQAFKMRSKDTSLAQDGSVQTVRHLSMPYPVEYGIGGCFQLCSKSGVMAASLAANSPIYSFRWVSLLQNAIVRRVRLQAWSLGTGFTAGLAFLDMFVCRAWTVADTGGTTETLGGDNGNLRTAMPATLLPELRHSATAALVAGTRTKDVQPVESMTYGITTAVNTPFLTTATKLFERVGAEHPLVLANNEGFTIQATVPAVGTWSWWITTEWDEVPLEAY
jgi:hypothetical protein